MAEVCPQADSWSSSEVYNIKTSHKWIITKFSKCWQKTGDFLKSSKFYADNDLSTEWHLKLYPNGQTEEDKDFVSITLSLVKSDVNEVMTEFKISIIDDKNQIHKQMEGRETPIRLGAGFGFRKFISRTILRDHDQQLLPNDCLTIYCEVSVSTRTTSSGRKLIPKTNQTPNEDIKRVSLCHRDYDIDIVVRGHKFSSHKAILRTRSLVFDAMFKESQQNLVIIEDINKEIFAKFLRFIYTDIVVNEDIDSNIELLSAADKYDLKDLKSICEEYIGSQLNVVKVCDVLIMADKYSAEDLKTKAIEFIKSNYIKVSKTMGWMEVIKRSDLLQLF